MRPDEVQDGWTVMFKTRAIDADVLAQLAPEQLGELAEIADFAT